MVRLTEPRGLRLGAAFWYCCSVRTVGCLALGLDTLIVAEVIVGCNNISPRPDSGAFAFGPKSALIVQRCSIMMLGALVSVLIALLIVGLVLWAITQIPLDPVIARVIRVVVIVIVCIWLIYFLAGFLPVGASFPLRH
jgi:cytochrome b subunit of formate dehydrogenase